MQPSMREGPFHRSAAEGERPHRDGLARDPDAGTDYGAFQREMPESKDRSRIFMRVKRLNDVTNVNFSKSVNGGLFVAARACLGGPMPTLPRRSSPILTTAWTPN